MKVSKRGPAYFGQLILGGVAVFALALCASEAPAKDLPDGGLTIEEVASWLQKDGYKAEIQKSSDGSQSILSSADGQDFHVDMYGCKDGRCDSMEFFEGFDTKGSFSAGKMNDWNRDHRWTRAYVDKESDPWIEYDVDLSPGGTEESLKDQFGIWLDAFSKFRKFIGW